MKKNGHLSEDQLIWAVVDEAELPAPVRDHLSTCSMCRTREKRLVGDLSRLGQAAERLAPVPGRKVELPQPEPEASHRWLWNWRIALGAGVVTALMVIGIWFALLLTAPEKGVPRLAREVREDERLMAEVRVLEEYALSPLHLEITGTSYWVLDEEFMDFVVPSLEDITSS